MLGVVLSGGQSTRMGTDKGLIRLEARNWAQTASEKLTASNLRVVISVNAAQYDTYATIFPADQLVKDKEELLLKGPLLGVLTVHAAFPDEDLLVLACDMPLMETAVLQQLVDAWQTAAQDACVFSNNHQPEPLCAIYRAAALARISAQHAQQPLARFSMKYLLEQLNVLYLPVQPHQAKAFRNFNAHAELNGL